MRQLLWIFLLTTLAISIALGEKGDPAAPVVLLSRAPALDGDPQPWARIPRQTIEAKDGKATFQLGYDAKNFYARVEVVDESPLRNGSAQPQEMFHGGDAVAFYFTGAGGVAQRVLFARREGKDEAYLYRPVSKQKQPYVFASPVGEAAFDYVAPLLGARSAYRLIPKGYVLEVAIPWNTLGLKPEGEFPFDLEVAFSDPAGTTKAGAIWWRARGSPGQTTEDLPTEARLYPETWGVARLMKEAPAAVMKEKPASSLPGIPIQLELPRAGRVSLLVRDEAGWIVRELLRAERHEKGKLRVEWDGRDRYGEPLPPAKYRWQALLFDGVGARFAGSVGSSASPPYRTPDGMGAMGGQHGASKSLAADPGGIYLGGAGEEGQPSLRKIDPATGQALWKRSAGGFGMILAVATDEGKAYLLNATGRPGERRTDVVPIDPATGLNLGKGDAGKINLPNEASITGFAVAGGRAWFSVPAENRVGSVELANGKAMPDVAVPAPQGLGRLDADYLLVCSEKSVLKLNVRNGKPSAFISGLEAPRAVCADAEGNCYVSDLGASQQIKKFSKAGKLLATFGRAGGKPRTMAPYDPLAFDKVSNLVIGPNGDLWLAEHSKMPNRFVKLTTSGKWLQDVCGPVAYNTFGPDLDDPGIVYYNTEKDDARVVQTKVDYARYAANPLAPSDGWQITAIHDLGLGADGKSVNQEMANVASNGYGHLFAFTASNGRRYLFRPSKDNRGSAPPGAGLWVWTKERWLPVVYLSRDEARHGLSWRDENGDGLMQDGERFPGLPTSTFAWVDRDLVLHGFEGTLAPQKVSAAGVPDYRGGVYHPYLAADQPAYRDGWTFVSPQVQGAVYYAANPGPERHLSFWDRAAENRLIKVQDGRVQWVIGQHSEKADFAEFSTVSGIAGIVDDLFIAHNVEPANYIAFTTDGFTLGNVIADETGRRPGVGPIAINIESFTGFLMKDPKSGQRFLFSVSSGDDRILEITGPGEMTRWQGEVALASSLPLAQNGGGLEIPYQYWRGNVMRTASVDGLPAEWPETPQGVSLLRGGIVQGDVLLRRDNGALHVLANLLSPALPKEGEGIELRLARDAHSQPVTIFLPAAPREPGIKSKKGGGATISRQGPSQPASEVELTSIPRWHGYGYRLEARIPLTLLPELSAPRQQSVRRAGKNPKSGKMDDVVKETATVADLPETFFLQMAALRQEGGVVQRIAPDQKSEGPATAP